LASGPINPPSGAALYALQVLDETAGGAADAQRVAGALASTQRVPRHGALGCGRLGYLHTHLHLQNANTAQGSVRRTLATARDATPSPDARRVSPVRAKPWARWGAAGRVIRSHVPAETRARLKAGAAQNGRRRGTAARAAHRAAGPRPWRAWVRPAGARAHLHLHQHIHGTKAGFTAARDTAKRTHLTSGLAARRALGAAHDGAAPDGATRGVPPAHLQKRQELHRNSDSTGASRLGVATTPGCR
jgi:hypothetical protein